MKNFKEMTEIELFKIDHKTLTKDEKRLWKKAKRPFLAIRKREKFEASFNMDQTKVVFETEKTPEENARLARADYNYRMGNFTPRCMQNFKNYNTK